MRILRTGTPTTEEWDEDDIMSHLNCDKSTAKKIMEECRRKNNLHGYGPIEKHLILDFINEKQREEREREARHKADLATVRQVSVLEEQVKTLKEQSLSLKEESHTLREQLNTLRIMSDSSSKDARKAHTQSLIANFISFISIAIAIISLVLK